MTLKIPSEDAASNADTSREASPHETSSQGESSGSESESERSEESCKKKHGHYVCKKKRCLKDTRSSQDNSSASGETSSASESCEKYNGHDPDSSNVDTEENAADTEPQTTDTNNSTSEAPETATEPDDVPKDTSGSAAVSGGGWTLSEDNQLRGMKQDSRGGPTWAEIAQVLGRSKKDVRERWKSIKDQPGQIEPDDPAPVGRGQDPEPDAGEEGPRATDTDESDSDPDNLGDKRRRHDARYLHRHVYPDLYPRTISPTPCEGFDRRDCEVLAAVDSRYKHSRWLEMQANFYNVTGRMVPLWIIRDRCERAEEPGQASRGRVGRWVDEVEQENLGNPEC